MRKNIGKHEVQRDNERRREKTRRRGPAVEASPEPEALEPPPATGVVEGRVLLEEWADGNTIAGLSLKYDITPHQVRTLVTETYEINAGEAWPGIDTIRRDGIPW